MDHAYTEVEMETLREISKNSLEGNSTSKMTSLNSATKYFRWQYFFVP